MRHPMEVEREFGAKVRTLRKAHGMSQTALAKRMADLGWVAHQTTVNRIEHGTRPLRLSESIDLATILGIDLAALVAPDSTRSEAALDLAIARAELAKVRAHIDLLGDLVDRARALSRDGGA